MEDFHSFWSEPAGALRRLLSLVLERMALGQPVEDVLRAARLDPEVSSAAGKDSNVA